MLPEIAEVLEGKRRWTVIHAPNEEVLPTLPDKSVAHVITDPPYASEIYERCKKNPARQDDKVSEGLLAMVKGAIGTIDDVLDSSAREFGRITQRWALVFTDVEGVSRWRAALTDSGMRYLRCGAWVKPDAMPQFSGDRPGQGFEAAVICHAKDKARWNAGGKLGVWTHYISKGDQRPDHPCPKPVPLMLEIVADFTDPDDVVIDPFCGSGTTGVACLRRGRRFIGIERSAEFAELARERLAAETQGMDARSFRAGQLPMFGADR